MADPEHLSILKQGVNVWNKWRSKNPNIKPDLRRAQLTEANLEGANFKETNLDWTKFYKANLSSADFTEVDLSSADLRGANLKKANLEKTNLTGKSLYGIDFRGANLGDANLTNAQFLETNLEGAKLYGANFSGIDFNKFSFQGFNLSEAKFIKSNLSDANFKGSTLKRADLSKTNLIRTDFTNANLDDAILKSANIVDANFSSANCIRTNFIGAVLSGANFSKAVLLEADFRAAHLIKANLSASNLRGANLGMANLTMADLRKADLTGSCLFSTSRDGWKIDDIKCEFIYWDNERKIRTPQKNIFQPGEFEELYKQLPTVEYVFEKGFTPIDTLIMNRVVQAINERHPKFELKLDSFHSRGRPHAVFTVLHKEIAQEALNQIKAGYEDRIARLEGEREALERCFNRALEEPRAIIKRIEMGDTYKINGQAAAVGPGAHAHDITFNQAWNDISKEIDLSKLSEELSVLKETVASEAKSSDQIRALAEVSDAETAAKAGKGSKVVEHLKRAGKWTFDVATNIGTDVAAEVIKKSMGL
jgi:uncharacterized protein YjbI with pentapeptide repeats